MLTDLEQAQFQLAEVAKNNCRIKATLEHWRSKLQEAEKEIDSLEPELAFTDRMMREATGRVLMIEESLEKAQGEKQ